MQGLQLFDGSHGAFAELPVKAPTASTKRIEMTPDPLATLYQSLDQQRPATLEALLAGVALLLPILDAIPNAAIFIKDPDARYVLANNTLVQRCGLKRLQPLLGKTSAEVFPAQLGPGYTEQDRRVLKDGLVLEDQLELHLYGSREPGWCLTHKRPLYNPAGQIIGLVGISVDVQSAADTHPAYQRLAAVDEHIRRHFHQPISMGELTRIARLCSGRSTNTVSAMTRMPDALGNGWPSSIMSFMRGRKIHCSHCSKLKVSTAKGTVLANASSVGASSSHQPCTCSSRSISSRWSAMSRIRCSIIRS